MTTQAPETLEALHLWLATELPELRLYSRHDVTSSGSWFPNVSTDALLEALRRQGRSEVKFSMATDSTRTVCSIDSFLAKGFEEAIATSGVADTLHEALCRVARKALEAS